ncbi:class A beta-lactamase-related serine hydrolase [Clostridium gasigenes]|uniref:serine hydrolase n=1 Tax=Clostridium gasigenes TaxID=94869 RepID=UPI001C0C3E9F|nr:serine hydrolase [Clostridium gasigenes]MBU3135435.1 class A beta-lactamase-related serine hydrolase [Clostridium gasigenes]
MEKFMIKIAFRKVRVVTVSIIFLLLTFNLICCKTFANVKTGNLEKEIGMAEDKLKNHQLLSLSGTEEALETNISIEQRIALYLEGGIKDFGFIYYDLTTKEKIVINQNKVFIAASTYKVGLNMLVYEDIINGVLEINQGIIYDDDKDFEYGTGILKNEIDTTLTKPVLLQKLLDLSIIESDNIASKMLKRTLGGDKETRERINEMAELSCDTDSNKTTPEIQFKLLENLYKNRDNIYYTHLLNIMKETEFHDRLDKYLPYEIVAHKIGNYEESINDIAIIFTDKPYIIVAYSEGIDEANEKIAKISKMIYSEQLKK